MFSRNNRRGDTALHEVVQARGKFFIIVELGRQLYVFRYAHNQRHTADETRRILSQEFGGGDRDLAANYWKIGNVADLQSLELSHRTTDTGNWYILEPQE